MNITRQLVCKLYNPLVSFIFKNRVNRSDIESDLEEVAQVKELQKNEQGAISDHLMILYAESAKVKPKLIVELGVRGGTSTFVFEKVAKRNNSVIVGVDIEDCPKVTDYQNHYFVKQDDIKFAANFGQWCDHKNICPVIDILFIDSSHEYEHTKKEIEVWLSYLSEKCKVFFHDSNMGKTYYRKDNSIGFGWDNDRGVIRAIEEYLNTSLDETKRFMRVENNWLIEHYPYSSGFTVLTKI
jgi:cephalosporin hydroxylase